jgi:hypothetical protein
MNLEQESELIKKFIKEVKKNPKQDKIDKLKAVAKKLKLGVFGDDTYQPQAPYFMGFEGDQIAIFRNDFYQRPIVKY